MILDQPGSMMQRLTNKRDPSRPAAHEVMSSQAPTNFETGGCRSFNNQIRHAFARHNPGGILECFTLLGGLVINLISIVKPCWTHNRRGELELQVTRDSHPDGAT